jgi:hypothetical protein
MRSSPARSLVSSLVISAIGISGPIHPLRQVIARYITRLGARSACQEYVENHSGEGCGSRRCPARVR